MSNKKKIKINKLVISDGQLAINFVHGCKGTTSNTNCNHIEKAPSENRLISANVLTGKVISFNSVHEKKLKEIINLTLETTKSF